MCINIYRTHKCTHTYTVYTDKYTYDKSICIHATVHKDADRVAISVNALCSIHDNTYDRTVRREKKGYEKHKHAVFVVRALVSV